MAAPGLVSVIVPAHNSEQTVLEQLNALAAQVSDTPWEVVVVLNQCTDNTEQLVREWSSSVAVASRVVVANERAGASYARNQGAAAAMGDALLFCDADDVVQPGWIAHMTTALATADVVGGRFIPHPTNSARVMKTFPLELALQHDSLPRVFGRVHFVATGSLGCRRQVFDTLGGFSPDFPHGSEDIVFSIEAQRNGFRLGFAPEAQCAYRSRSNVGAVTRQRSLYQRSHAQVIATFAPEEDAGLLSDLLHLVASAARALVPVPPSLVRRRFALLRIQATRVRAAAALRRRGDAQPRPTAESETGERLVDVTLPLDWQLVGGLGFAAPLAVARTIANRHDLRDQVARLAGRAGALHRAYVIGDDIGVLTVAAHRIVGPEGLVVVAEPDDVIRAALHENLERHAPGVVVETGLDVAESWPKDDSTEVLICHP